jgi:hypothetical protein
MTYSCLAGCIASGFANIIPSPWETWNGSLDGSAATYSSGNNAFNQVSLLTTNTVINIYEDIANSNLGTAVVGTISGTTISWGTPAVFSGTNAIAQCSIVALSATQAIVCYRDTADSDKGKAVILDISGTTITVNSPVTFASTGIDAVSVTMLTSSSALVVWNDPNTLVGSSMVLSISGSNITTNSEFDFAPLATATNCIVSAISATQALVIYSDDNNSSYGTAQVLDISGTSVTGNTNYVFNSSSSSLFRIAKITTNTFALAYKNVGDSNFPNVQILSLAGTVVSYGAGVRIINLAALDGYFAIAKADSQSAYILYRNVTTTQAAARVAIISGTTITLKTPVIVKASAAQAMAACNIDNTHIMNIFRDQGNSNKGTGLVSAV